LAEEMKKKLNLKKLKFGNVLQIVVNAGFAIILRAVMYPSVQYAKVK